MNKDQTFSFLVAAPNAHQMHTRMMISKASQGHLELGPFVNKRLNVLTKNVRIKKQQEDSTDIAKIRGELFASIGAAMYSYDPDDSICADIIPQSSAFVSKPTKVVA